MSRFVSNKSVILDNLNVNLDIPLNATFKLCLFVARIENATMDSPTSAIQSDFNNRGQMIRDILKSRLPKMDANKKNAIISNIDFMTCSLIDSGDYDDLVNFNLPWNMREYTHPDAQDVTNPRMQTSETISYNRVCGSSMNSSYLKRKTVTVNGKKLTLTRVVLCQVAEWIDKNGVNQTKTIPCTFFTFSFEDNKDTQKKCICIVDSLCSVLRSELLIYTFPPTGNMVVCFTKFGNQCDIGLSALTKAVSYYMKEMRFRNWEEVKQDIIDQDRRYDRTNEASIMDGLDDYLDVDTYIGKTIKSSRMIRQESNDEITSDKINELNLEQSDKFILSTYFKYGKDPQRKLEFIKMYIKLLTNIIIELKIQQAISSKVILWIEQSTDNLVEPAKIQKLNLTEDEKRGLIEYFNLSKDANPNDPLLNEILTKLKLERETVSYILKQIKLNIKSTRLTKKFVSKLKSEVEWTKLSNALNEGIKTMSPSKQVYKTLKARTTWKRAISKVLTNNKTKRENSPKTTWKRIINKVISQNKTKRSSIRLNDISVHDK